MRTVRRLYYYAVAFVSLEVVIWGTIWLARSIFCSGNALCATTSILAQGLAFILVGLPVFGIHWWLAQRFARQDGEERASGVRAVFLYGVLLATLIPIVQNILSLWDRLALQAVALSPSQALFGPNQNWTDNLIAVVMNSIAAAYIFTILRADLKDVDSKDAFADIRRIYRHVWLLYSLVMVVASVQQLLRFILSVYPNLFSFLYRASGAHGIILALVGVPLWIFSWRAIREALSGQSERDSLLRLGVLYLLSLAGVITVLASGGVIMNFVLRFIFGESFSFSGFIEKVAPPLSIGIPLAGVWAYYGRQLGSAIAESPDAPRRAGMRRLYSYILSAIGLGATFIGLSMLLSFIIDSAFGNIVWADVLRPRLAAPLATLLVSLPLWWLCWRPMQVEALAAGDAGDHARRSIIRRVYLYLALFIAVLGGMIMAAGLLTMLLRALLGNRPDNLVQSVLDNIELLFLFAGLGVYHGNRLGQDGKLASRALAEKHAVFPVMVFDPGDGSFGQTLLAAFHKQTPQLPVVLQTLDRPVAKDASPKAVILPFELAADPPDSLRKWLAKYKGTRLAIPNLTEAWQLDGFDTWICTGGARPLPEAAGQAAQIVRQLAEGQEIRQRGGASGWMIFVYIGAGLFGMEILMALISLSASLISR